MQPAYVPWRERAFLSIDEAALIMGKSPDWIRRRIRGRQIEAVQFVRAGPLAVKAHSLAQYVDRIGATAPRTLPPRPYLRLVIDNT